MFCIFFRQYFWGFFSLRNISAKSTKTQKIARQKISKENINEKNYFVAASFSLKNIAFWGFSIFKEKK
jgi:hypothetical protein